MALTFKQVEALCEERTAIIVKKLDASFDNAMKELNPFPESADSTLQEASNSLDHDFIQHIANLGHIPEL